MTRPVRVIVDTAVCALSGYCEHVAGDVLTLNDDGLTVPAAPVTSPDLIARLLEAEAVCPTGALHVKRLRPDDSGAAGAVAS